MPLPEATLWDLPPLRLDHLRRLTDDTGLMQHALYCTPDPHHGYTTDDNARALLLMARLIESEGPEQYQELAFRYLAFLRYAQRDDGAFHNFLAFDRRWLDERGSQDCQGRAAAALGTTLGRALLPGLADSAAVLLDRAMPVVERLTAPRAEAYAIMGLCWAVQAGYQVERCSAQVLRMASHLIGLYRATADADWRWFENILTYSNASLPEALMHAFVVSQAEEHLAIALESLEFLCEVCFVDGMLDLVGQNGWFPRGGKKAAFDQQPIDAQAMVEALVAAYELTGEERYQKLAFEAFTWFLGNNRLGQPLYDPTTAGCFDGLQEDRVNGNQGAESTLAFLLARLALEQSVLPRVPSLVAAGACY